jgi:hypothetical protein
MGRSLPWFDKDSKLDPEEDPVVISPAEDDLQSLVGAKSKSVGPFQSAQHAAYTMFGLGAIICFMYSLVVLQPLTAGVSAMLVWLCWHTYWVHTERCQLYAKLAKAQEKAPQPAVVNTSPRRSAAAAADQGLAELDMTGFAKSLGMQFDNSLPQSGTMTKVMMVTLVKEYLRTVTELQQYQAKYGPLDGKSSVSTALPPALLAGLTMMPAEQVAASPEASARSHGQQESSRSVSQAEYESRADANSQSPGSPPRSTSHSRQTSPDKPPRCAPSNDETSNVGGLQEPAFAPEPRGNSRPAVVKDFAHAITEAPAGPPSRRADARSPMTNGPGGPGGPGLGAPGLGAGIPSLDGGLAPRRTGTMSLEPTGTAQRMPEASKEEAWRPRCFRQATAAEQKESEDAAKPQTSQYRGLFGQGPPPATEESKPEPAKPVHFGLFGAR